MDTWPALAPALLSPVGVGLGTVGTLVGQHLSSRVSTRQHAAQQWVAHRAELKASIMRFVRLVHQVLNGDGQVIELWLAQHELDLVAISEELRGATYRYARCVAAVTADEPFEGERDAVVRAAQIEFMDAARRDLWPADRAPGPR